MELDSVQIGVADLDEATAAYTLLLGVEPVRLAGEVRRFQLGRGAVELESGEPGVHSVRFVGEQPAGWPDAFHGLTVQLGARPALAAAAEAPAIDHVVVRTPDADRAICLWRDRLGLRPARDRLFPERGLRLVFLQSGGMTLEVATSDPPPAAGDPPDCFYRVSSPASQPGTRRARLPGARGRVRPACPRL